jgi:alpha-tubulin suppressor-like RCC1 family protein
MLTILKPTKINISNIIDIDGGDFHSLLINSEQNVFSFGSNEYKQLGHNKYTDIPNVIDDLTNIIQISAGNTHSIVLTSEKKVIVFGNNYVLIKNNHRIINVEYIYYMIHQI